MNPLNPRTGKGLTRMSYETEEKLSDITAEMREHTAGKAADMYYDKKSWMQLCDRIDSAAERLADKANSLICHLIDARVRQSKAVTDAESVERELDEMFKSFTGR